MISMNGRKGNYNIFTNESKFDIMKELNIRENNFVRKGILYQKFEGKKQPKPPLTHNYKKTQTARMAKYYCLLKKDFTGGST